MEFIPTEYGVRILCHLNRSDETGGQNVRQFRKRNI